MLNKPGQAEYKGQDKTHPDPVGGNTEASSFGTGGHDTHQPMQVSLECFESLAPSQLGSQV